MFVEVGVRGSKHYILFCMFTMKSDTEFYCGAPVSQLAKRRPADLAVSGLCLVRGGNLSESKRSFIAHSLSVSTYHRLNMTNTVKKDVKSQVIYPSKLYPLFFSGRYLLLKLSSPILKNSRHS